MFIARFDLDGNLGWVEKLVHEGYFFISDLAADSSGVYATGSFRKTVVFGLDADGGLLTMTAAEEWISDGFLVKLSDSDNGPVWEWGQQFVGVGVAAVASDGSHVYVSAGDHAEDNGIFTGLEFIARFDTGGNLEWYESWPNGIAYDIAVRDGFLYLTGIFSGMVDFNLDPSLTKNLTAGGVDAFVWKMTDEGVFQWAGPMGGPTRKDLGAGITVDHLGNVITTGYFLALSADLDPSSGTDALIRLGRGDAFVSKVGPTMTHQWAFQIGSIDQFADDGQNEYGVSYNQSGNRWKTVNSGGYMYDYRTHPKGAGANKAQWVISGLPNGQYECLRDLEAEFEERQGRGVHRQRRRDASGQSAVDP